MKTKLTKRRDVVVLSGSALPVVEQGENCSVVAKELIKKELKIDMPTGDISVAHRIGRKPVNQAPDRRDIVVKLCRRDLKSELVSASRKQPKPLNLFINESLTPKRKSLLLALRRMKKAHPDLVKGSTSLDGRIYAYTKPVGNSSRDQRHLINTHESLSAFCREFIKKPLDEYLQHWSF